MTQYVILKEDEKDPAVYHRVGKIEASGDRAACTTFAGEHEELGTISSARSRSASRLRERAP